mgnify:CR=1 FL=1
MGRSATCEHTGAACDEAAPLYERFLDEFGVLRARPHGGLYYESTTSPLSGAISKTVNMPEDVTVEDVEGLHLLAWELGLKSVAIYRDNCKLGQPLSTSKATVAPVGGLDRRRLRRAGRAHSRSPPADPADLTGRQRRRTWYSSGP